MPQWRFIRHNDCTSLMTGVLILREAEVKGLYGNSMLNIAGTLKLLLI